MKWADDSIEAHYFTEEGYGRISAPIDNPEEGIARAEDWLRLQGCTLAYGPIGASTWTPYRATLGPFARPMFFGESNFNPNPWVKLGYEVVATYTSNLAENQSQIKSSVAYRAALLKQGWRLLSLNDLDTQQTLKRCYDISQRSFSHAFCYRSISQSDFLALYQSLLQKIDPRLVLFAQCPKGSIVGFCLAYPDIQNPELRQFILKSLAVAPSYSGQGVGSWLVGEVHRVAEDLGYTNGGIHALMWAGSHSTKISAHAGILIRKYALYQKRL